MSEQTKEVKSEPQSWERCFTCRCWSEECMPISASEASDPNSVTVFDVLIKHFWFKREEFFGKAHVICENCWYRLDNFHQFYQLVEENHRALNQEPSKASGTAENSTAVIHYEDEIDIKEDYDWHRSEGEEPETERSTSNISGEELKESTLAPRRSERNVKHKQIVDSEEEEEEDDEDDKIIKAHMQYKCSICAKDCKKFYPLKRHMAKVHKEKAIVTCCGMIYYKRIGLLEHVQKLQDPNRFKCDVCDKVLVNSSAVRRHKREIHATNKDKKFRCNRCPRRFVRAKLLENHLKGHTNMDKGSIRCPHCQKAFPSEQRMKGHIKFRHARKSFVCDECKKRFVTELHLKRHKQEHVSPEELRVQCDVCKQWLKNMNSFRMHKRLHTGPMTCKVCGIEFEHYQALSKHRISKHNKKKSKRECLTCGEQFKQAAQLKKHRAAVHG